MSGWGAAIAAIAGASALGLGAAWAFQGALLYAPDSADPGPASRISPSATDLTLHTGDGVEISGWRFDPDRGSTRAVLYLPGNGGNRAGRAPLARAFTDRGFTAVFPDYRGFGGNPGTPHEAGLLADAHAALGYLLRSGFAPENVFLVGESLGTAVAVHVAASQEVGGVLLRSPFTSMPELARSLVKVPLGWLLRDHYDSLERIGSVTAAVTILAGSEDDLVPPSQSEHLARHTPTLHRYVEVPGAGHNDAVWFGPFVADQLVDLAAEPI